MPEFEFKAYQNLINRLSKLAFDDSRKDVTFTFEKSDAKIKAHKSILEAASSVFKTMFSGKFAEEEEVKITEIRPDVFQLLIKYLLKRFLICVRITLIFYLLIFQWHLLEQDII